jgi:drug/metabolite transporter (DMT)-like permease
MFVIALSLGTIAFVNGNYASVAVIMAFPTPAIIAVVMLGERISLKETLLVSVAFIGAAITIFGGTGQTIRFEWPLICAFVATVFISYSILARKKQTPFLNNYETTLLMLVTAAVAMTILSGCWIVWSQNVPHVSGRTVWVALLAGFANIGFLLLSNFAIPNLKGVVTNNVLSLQPLFGAIVGFTVFHERPTSLSLLGGSIIFISVILIANPAFFRPNSVAKSGI